MSIYILGAFIDYLRETGKDVNKPIIEYKKELENWKRLYNNR